MLNQFDPKERKAILIFFAVLLLAIVYLSESEMGWDSPTPLPNEQNPQPVVEEYPQYDDPSLESEKKYSYDRYF